jgi:hypothetical protein
MGGFWGRIRLRRFSSGTGQGGLRNGGRVRIRVAGCALGRRKWLFRISYGP